MIDLPRRRLLLASLASLGLPACISNGSRPPAPLPSPPLKIGLALGGGAAKGFAHIGVIKALEAQGVVVDVVAGTSAGSVVGALYAAGLSGFELQKLAMELDESQVSDWSLPDRGVFKGEALQNFVNKTVGNQPLERLRRSFAAVATDLRSGELIAFRTGNTGMAVRASSAVPGVFQPVAINGREYVDGGAVSPVPVRTARAMGANFVIAVDISAKPRDGKTQSTVDVLLQTFSIMGQAIGRFEMAEADLVIRPATAELPAADFQARHKAILEGEKAAAQVMPELKAKLDAVRRGAAG